jgi:hypothetical protein
LETWRTPVAVIWNERATECAFILEKETLGHTYYVKAFGVQKEPLEIKELTKVDWIKEALRKAANRATGFEKRRLSAVVQEWDNDWVTF